MGLLRMGLLRMGLLRMGLCARRMPRRHGFGARLLPKWVLVTHAIR